ncbi:hypothetical protein H0H93_007150 [Arthromyces matolae]|nr:hypothetical protein H0H93_007150 [Arthromyces matolae]
MAQSLTGHLGFIAAPMVNQSDLPFRSLVRKNGCSLAYTQMLMPDKILNNPEYLEHHLRDLTLDEERGRPVVVQLCGNDVQTIVQAGRKLQGYCDGIVSGMSQSFTVPTSVKIRLAQPVEKTLEFGQRLEGCGASWITLHARTVSARRRRQGAAALDQVRKLKQGLRIPVISNGNVREWSNIPENLEYTGADGVMVGETLLGNPCLFANKLPDPVDIALEYLEICHRFPRTAPIPTIQTHIRHFIEYQCGRRPWFQKFRTALTSTTSVEEMEQLLRVKVERWRGRPPRSREFDTENEDGGFEMSSGTSEGDDDQPIDLSLML